jgi:hypothetical protein
MDRIPKDKYYTFDPRAYEPMREIFSKIGTFIEPCAGGGDMIIGVEVLGPKCIYACDIEPDDPTWVPDEETDLNIVTGSYDGVPKKLLRKADYIITNPPWTRADMHAFIQWCIESGVPAWLLLDSNWAWTKQARPFLTYCSDIVPTARLKWIPGTKHAAKDDTSWYRFQSEPCETILRNCDPPKNLADDLL